MARSEARVLVDIWDDEDFLVLSPAAQRMFLFLISQRDLEHTGVIALRERRWAKGAAGMTAADVVAALGELEHARFVVLDEEAEELLVRSFIRRDKVFKQPNVMRSATDRVDEIKSRRLREELLVELHRIVETESMSESALEMVEEMRGALAKACGNPSRNPSVGGSGEATDVGSEKGCQLRLGEWGMGNGEEVEVQDQNPGHPDAKSTNGEEPPGRRSTDKTGKRPSTHPKLTWADKEIDADPLFAAFWDAYPRKADKGDARKAWLSALRNKAVAAQQLVEAAAHYRADPTRERQFTKLPATWLNKECWANYDEVEPDDEDDPDNVWAN